MSSFQLPALPSWHEQGFVLLLLLLLQLHKLLLLLLMPSCLVDESAVTAHGTFDL